jgi:hypothetical protein
MRALILIVLSTVIIIFSSMQINEDQELNYVPNDTTAIKIAEAVWLPIYGKRIYSCKPFKAKLIDSITWEVSGTLHADKGGCPHIELRKSDGKILSVYHGK